jgi:ubiquinone/menaquinone biosynthesis C-methylase UbiE
LITAETGCRYLGVDYSASALQIARTLAGALPCRFEQAHVPPLPDGRFDVVLLLETMLAFADKAVLLAEVARVMPPGGRFALTVEEGVPLRPVERAATPDADTVWLVELAELTALLRDAGFSVTWQQECTAAHHATATALLHAYQARSEQLAGQLGTQAVDELIRSHQLWRDWLETGRVRKFALVAERS